MSKMSTVQGSESAQSETSAGTQQGSTEKTIEYEYRTTPVVRLVKPAGSAEESSKTPFLVYTTYFTDKKPGSGYCMLSNEEFEPFKHREGTTLKSSKVTFEEDMLKEGRLPTERYLEESRTFLSELDKAKEEIPRRLASSRRVTEAVSNDFDNCGKPGKNPSHFLLKQKRHENAITNAMQTQMHLEKLDGALNAITSTLPSRLLSGYTQVRDHYTDSVRQFLDDARERMNDEVTKSNIEGWEEEERALVHAKSLRETSRLVKL
ncbi:hypothetical protein IAU59_002765 [Kwoniella sp. CBS 9459]